MARVQTGEKARLGKGPLPFSARYPWLAELLDEVPDDCPTNNKCAAAPFGEVVRDNVAVDVGGSYVWSEVVAKWSGGGTYDFPVDFAWEGIATNVERVSTKCLAAGTTPGTLNPSNSIANGVWDVSTCTLTFEVDKTCRCCDGGDVAKALLKMEADGEDAEGGRVRVRLQRLLARTGAVKEGAVRTVGMTMTIKATTTRQSMAPRPLSCSRHTRLRHVHK